tara:strand:- start:902 stop:1513 length:612 start_codon:yes stop_codon:yes gene_type:complete
MNHIRNVSVPNNKFQEIKSENITGKAEIIFREIVQNCVYNNYYNLCLVDNDGRKEKIKFSNRYQLEEEYPIVILNKKDKITTWEIPRTLLNLPNNKILYNEYHSMKRSIDFVFVGNGQIEWKREMTPKKWVSDLDGVNEFTLGCLIGFELVYTCDVNNNKYSDLDEYDIKPIYRVDALELIKQYNICQSKNELMKYIPVSKII